MRSGLRRAIKVLEERVGAIDHDDVPRRDMRIDFPLHRLPSLGPEPALVGRHRQHGAKLNSPVVMLEQFELRARLIEMQAPAKLNRQRDRPACLHGDVVSFHGCSIAAMLQDGAAGVQRIRPWPTHSAFVVARSLGPGAKPRIRGNEVHVGTVRGVVRLTRHARARARQRGIALDVIVAVYLDPDEIRPSPAAPDREIRSRLYDRLMVEIVVDLIDGSVVSAWLRRGRS